MPLRTYVAIVAAVVLGFGVLGLLMPVHTMQPPTFGRAEITCGTGFTMDEGVSADTLGFYQECPTAIAVRRVWAFGAIAIGGLVLIGAAVVRQRVTQPASR